MIPRSWLLVVVFGGAIGAELCAQTHVIKKPDTVVRAVGVYEWTGEEGKPTASRLMPVTVFINAQLEDAGVYLARPVPFALQTGTLFDIERAGVTRGTLELAYARHVQTTGGAEYDDGWLAVGAFKPKPQEPVFAAKKSGPLPQIAVSGGKGPHFGNKDAPGKDALGKEATQNSSNDGVDRSSAVGGGTTVSAANADRTVGQSKADSPDAGGGNARASIDPNDDADRPTLRKRTPAQNKAAKKERDQASVAGVGQLNDDPDRPNLHRGKPVTRMEEEDLPPLLGLPSTMHQEAAVSDAKDRPEHPFLRSWENDAERTGIMAKMRELARIQLTQYDRENGVSTSVAAPKAVARVRRQTLPMSKLATGSTTTAITDESLRGYTLSYGGAATYIYAASTSPAAGVARYVTIVVQQEPLGALKVAVSNVTDASHLDRTPWMRLVDAVDADASNRASLLFELRAEKTRQFALYRVIGAQAEQVFTTGTAP